MIHHFIDLSATENVKDVEEQHWVTVDDLKLTKQDEADLCSRSRAWLNDRHISAALMLLKKQHPHISGLQTPTLQCTRTFDVQEEKEFVQVLNMSGNHWITISTVGCPRGVFSGKSITIHHMHMQHQAGCSDCGLFALATATAICNGMDPGALNYLQRQM